VGEHTLLFAGASEHIALTHRAFDRRVFASGAIRAALWVQGRPAGLYTMMDVLGMR
jgi:4-hydroxy-tetrahydrodipicolinate reductase